MVPRASPHDMERRKCLASAGIRAPDRPGHNLLTIPTSPSCALITRCVDLLACCNLKGLNSDCTVGTCEIFSCVHVEVSVSTCVLGQYVQTHPACILVAVRHKVSHPQSLDTVTKTTCK